MDRNMKKLLCALAAVLLLTGCRSGGGATNAPSEPLHQQTAAPTVKLPEGESIEDWNEPADTAPVETTEPGSTQPQEGNTEPPVDPTQPPKQSDPSEPPAHSTEPTDPADPPAATEPPATTEPQTGSDPADLTYEEYLAMSPAEQQAHYESFPSLEAYIAWHEAALAEYEENQNSIEVTGGIDIGDYMNP